MRTRLFLYVCKQKNPLSTRWVTTGVCRLGRTPQMTTTTELTSEQQDIINDVKGGKHVSVVALPGSGKSRVAYEIIRQCVLDTCIVLIMYNRSLCDATTRHVQQMELAPGRVAKAFTFHGLASSLTGEVCHNDRHILRALRQPLQSPWAMEKCTLLIIDEAQDARPDLMALVHHMLKHACTERSRLRIVILGDPRQLLYDFYRYNRADARFLTLGPELFQATNARAWSRRRLTRSFRSTVCVTDFLNAVVPGHDMVSSGQEGPPVTVDICNVRSTDPASKVMAFVTRYAPEDVLILCSSLNRNSPAKLIVRTLVQNEIPVHVQRSGTIRETHAGTTTDHRCVQFKTFCASKGLEAKLVIVVNDRSLCHAMKNDLYVGLSRSMTELVVFQDRTAISQEEITSIQTGLANPSHVRFVWNRHRVFPPVTMPPPTYATATATNKYLKAETMFQYTDPTSLTPVETLVQSTMVDKGILDDEEAYVRLFMVGTVNVQCIIQQALRIAIDYHRRRRLPKYILDLGEATDPHIARLFVRGTQVLDMALPHVPDPWDFRNLCLKLQAFAMFATAKDARQGFDDKIRHLEDFGFIMHACVVARLRRLVAQMDKYIPDRSTPFMRITYRRIDDTTRISGRPLIRSAACIYSIIDAPCTDVDAVLQMGLYIAIHAVEYGYLSNTHDGSLTQVYVPSGKHAELLTQIAHIYGDCDTDTTDAEFISRFKLTFPTPTVK